MKNKLIIGGLAVVAAGLSILSFASITAAKNGHFGSVRLTDNRDNGENNRGDRRKKNQSTNLTLINVAGTSASGTASIRTELFQNKLQKGLIKVVVNGTPATGKVFEGWLFDNDTGYKLSLGGLLPTRNNTRQTLDYNEPFVNFSIYDRLVVTEESLNDANPNPGTIILSVGIPSTSTVPTTPTTTAFHATLNSTSEVPPTTSTASGTGTFTLNTASNTLQFNISYTGLSTTELSAHIHGPATTSATATAQFTLPTGTPKIGTWNYPESIEPDIIAGRTYVNVHSARYPDGEIRGQIIQ